MGYNLDLYGLKKEEVDADYVYDWLPKAQAYDWHNASIDSYTEEEGIITVLSNKYSLHNMDESILLEIPVTCHTFRMIDLISPFHRYSEKIINYDKTLFPEIYFEVNAWLYTAPHFSELLDFLIPQLTKEKEEDLQHELEILKKIKSELAQSNYFYYLFDYF